MKILDYIILQAHGSGLLRNKVKRYLEKNYILHGSPFGIMETGAGNSSWEVYCQAMIKYDSLNDRDVLLAEIQELLLENYESQLRQMRGVKAKDA